MVGHLKTLASKSERQKKWDSCCRKTEPQVEGTIPRQQREKDFVENFFTDGVSEDQREEKLFLRKLLLKRGAEELTAGQEEGK